LRTQPTCIREFNPGASNLFREWKKILSAPVKSLRDRSLDWQDVDLVSDAIPLRKWKLRRLQDAVTRAWADTQFLYRGGQVVGFPITEIEQK
jgi:hypothetical protein